MDKIFGANTYSKWKTSFRWENQYFTTLFGYNLKVDYTKYNYRQISFGIDQITQELKELAQSEYMADIMLILNWNRNISLRPEYDIIYQELSNKKIFNKSRYWLNLHIIL